MGQQIKLAVYDQDGQPFVIPAETIEVEPRFAKHQFAVHKSINLGDDLWVVSHVASGAAMSTAGSKVTAELAARSKLKGLTLSKFAESVKKFSARLAELANAYSEDNVRMKMKLMFAKLMDDQGRQIENPKAVPGSLYWDAKESKAFAFAEDGTTTIGEMTHARIVWIAAGGIRLVGVEPVGNGSRVRAQEWHFSPAP